MVGAGIALGGKEKGIDLEGENDPFIHISPSPWGDFRIRTTQLKICTGSGTTCLSIGNLVSLCSRVTWMST